MIYETAELELLEAAMKMNAFSRKKYILTFWTAECYTIGTISVISIP